MKFKLKKHISDLRKNGITFISNFYTKTECAKYKKKFELILNKTKNQRFSSSNCQLIINPFRQDESLTDLLFDFRLDKIFKKLLDNNYVLIDSTAINRKINSKFNKKTNKSLGDNWHTDSRYNDNIRLDKGFSFLTISMFDEFTNDNSATLYVPGSLRKRSKPKRFYNYNAKKILGKAGTLVIMDTGIFHKAGSPSLYDRWSLFNYYGPWFMKPYFDFPKMMKGKKINKNIKKLLHFNSQPPINEIKRLNTITKL